VAWSQGVIEWCSSAHGHATDNFRPKRLTNVQSNPIKLGHTINPLPD